MDFWFSMGAGVLGGVVILAVALWIEAGKNQEDDED